MINLTEIWQAIEGRVVALIHKTEARGARVYRSTTQSINNNTLTALSFDTEVNDSDGCWAVGSPTHLTAQRDGYYMAGGSWAMAAAQNTTASRMRIVVRKNGTTHAGANELHTLANKDAGVSVTVGMIWMEEGDYVEICALHDEGSAKNVTAGSDTYPNSNMGWLVRIS